MSNIPTDILIHYANIYGGDVAIVFDEELERRCEEELAWQAENVFDDSVCEIG